MGTHLTARAGWVLMGVVAMTVGSPPVLAAENAAPKRSRWIPTVSLAIGSFDERLRVRVDGTDYDSYRSQYRTILALGLAHPVAELADERAWIDGHGSIGFGPTFDTGHWHLPLREDVTFAFAATRWLTLRGGLGVGITIDTSASSRSFAELAIPIGFTVFRTVELVYRPMLSVPLGSETSPVFGGESEISTRLTVLPFELMLRVRVNALGW